MAVHPHQVHTSVCRLTKHEILFLQRVGSGAQCGWCQARCIVTQTDDLLKPLCKSLAEGVVQTLAEGMALLPGGVYNHQLEPCLLH